MSDTLFLVNTTSPACKGINIRISLPPTIGEPSLVSSSPVPYVILVPDCVIVEMYAYRVIPAVLALSISAITIPTFTPNSLTSLVLALASALANAATAGSAVKELTKFNVLVDCVILSLSASI